MKVTELTSQEKIALGVRLANLGATTLKDTTWDNLTNLKPFVGIEAPCMSDKVLPIVEFVEDYKICRAFNPTLRLKTTAKVRNFFRSIFK